MYVYIYMIIALCDHLYLVFLVISSVIILFFRLIFLFILRWSYRSLSNRGRIDIFSRHGVLKLTQQKGSSRRNSAGIQNVNTDNLLKSFLFGFLVLFKIFLAFFLKYWPSPFGSADWIRDRERYFIVFSLLLERVCWTLKGGAYGDDDGGDIAGVIYIILLDGNTISVRLVFLAIVQLTNWPSPSGSAEGIGDRGRYLSVFSLLLLNPNLYL